MSLKRKILAYICSIHPYLTKKYFKDRGKGNKILIVENGKERLARPYDLPELRTSITGNNNLIKITLPSRLNRSKFCIPANDCSIAIGQNVSGSWNLVCYEPHSLMTIGSNTEAGSVIISLLQNHLIIGEKCMFSDNITIWGDGHAVLDVNTHKVLNKPSSPIIIGNHCWIGERVTLTKNAQIPDDSIVGIASVVTKKFIEEHTVIAGSPAKVVKSGITWHGFSPMTYEEKMSKIEKEKLF
ncbi:MAG: acyltransferase [Alphaproteobacteria bacterium]|nr:acyltransferase [Alphaproteobacteria bacterium]